MFISSFFFMSNVLPKRRGLPAYASGSCSLFLFARPTTLHRSSIPVPLEKHRHVFMRRIDAVVAVEDGMIICMRIDPRPSRGRSHALEQIVLHDDPVVIAAHGDGVPRLAAGKVRTVSDGVVLDDDVAAYTGVGIDANGTGAAVLHLVVTDDVVP